MSVLAPRNLQPAYTKEPIYRLTVDQYHDLINSGKLTADDPVELLDGILVFKIPKKPKHSVTTERARQVLTPLLSPGWFYRTQEPITLADGEPEPDGAIIRGRIDDYTARHPGPADVALVIEIADTTLDRDRSMKLRSYARAAIPNYWIINLIDRHIEAYSDPNPLAAPEPTFRARQIYHPNATIPVPLATAASSSISAADLLPPR